MKKLSFFLFAIMIASSLSAQIEVLDDSSELVSKQTTKKFNKSDLLYFLYGYQLWPDVLTNLIGEQLYGIADAGKQPFVVSKKDNTIFVEEFSANQYFYVKDILITVEEIDSLRVLIEQSSFNKKNIIKKKQILTSLFNFATWTEWRRAIDLSMSDEERSNFQKLDIQQRDWEIREKIKKALYILTDNSGTEYYVPSFESNLADCIEGKDGYIEMLKLKSGHFIIVKRFLELKQFYEGQRLELISRGGTNSWSFNTNRNNYLCEKIAIKGSNVVAIITDTLSNKLTTIKVLGVKQVGPLMALSLICKDNDEGKLFCTIQDVEATKNKIAYDEQLEEQERQQKDQRKKKEMIQRFGETFGPCVAEKKICIGMTKEMCKEAKGSPDDVSSSKSTLGTIEVWTYTMEYEMWHGLAPIIVVTFIDSKVTDVKEYKSREAIIFESL